MSRLVASSARPLPVRMRSDLEVRQHVYQGRTYFVIKEPMGLRYHRFEEEEYVLLTLLDGKSSLDDLKGRFEKKFRPQKITLEELQQFVGTLHRNNLVLADVQDQGDQLRQRRDKNRRQNRFAALGSLLSLRLKGIDPDPMLGRIYPRIRWMFAPAAVIGSLAMAVAALLLIIVQWDVFQSKLPSFEGFFAAENWIWMALALAASKILHEFGHALTCKHFGGECHEMGVMFLVLTPCLYVNVSDSWMLGNKWHRAAIGAAGMYVELVLASVCTFLWWFSEPGLLNYLCLSTMFVSSVSTLLFNANPLLRFDGYYILSDILEIPNLRQKASTILHRKLSLWCLGLTEPFDPFLPRKHQGFFAFYTVAAAIYRWIVTFSILWFLYKLFEPYRLEILGQLIASAALISLIGLPIWRLVKFFHVPGRVYRVKHTRLSATLGGLAVLGAAALFVPLPSAVYCSLEIKPRDATAVYVDVPGRLQQIHVIAGQQVDAGSPLAELTNLDVDMAVARLTGERDGLRAQLASLKRRRFHDREAGLDIEQTRDSLAALDDQLQKKQRDRERLTLSAPVSGTILPPSPVLPRGEEEIELAVWTGTPLETRNVGATLAESTLFCQIGDPRRLEAVLLIDQADVERVREGLNVEISLSQLPGKIYQGQILEMAHNDLDIGSGSSSSNLTKQADHRGTKRPQNTSYQALVILQDQEAIVRPGLTGNAKIDAPWETVATRFWRYLARTFHFKL